MPFLYHLDVGFISGLIENVHLPDMKPTLRAGPKSRIC